MSSAGTPNPWTPYDRYRDCSQGVCSIDCPQWCYIIFPPPPPSPFFDEEDSGTDFSPLLIALIGILAGAFVLISYYTIISKFCRRRRGSDADADADVTIHHGQSAEDATWRAGGLDETLIKSIKVYKYRKLDGFVDCTDCSVCLSQFEENESLRLLPKCNHAFHAPCIDTWLRSHSNCPLCRASIGAIEPNRDDQASNRERDRAEVSLSVSALQYRSRNDDLVTVIQDPESGVRDESVVTVDRDFPKSPIRRSASMDSSLGRGGSVLIADILRENEDEESIGVGSSERTEPEKTNLMNGVSSFLIRSSMAMKRSVSTGRFVFTRYCDRGRDSALPN